MKGLFSNTGYVLILVFGVAIALSACSNQPKADSGHHGVQFQLEKSDEERLLSYYLSGYLNGVVSEPSQAGLIQKRQNIWYLQDPEGVSGADSMLQTLYSTGMEEGEISWDAFESFISQTYYESRTAPETVDDLRSVLGDWSQEGDWFHVELNGSMTQYRRRISVERRKLVSAVRSLNTASDPILYEPGTAFIGEHLLEGEIVETTAMVKQNGGHWDYYAYNGQGILTDEIFKDPDDMKVPTECTGCHFGDRLFEPERSFPARPRPGPNGERSLHVGENARDSEVVAALQEHARRSDLVLGLYATLYLSEIRQKLIAGSASEEEIETLQRLGFANEPQ